MSTDERRSSASTWRRAGVFAGAACVAFLLVGMSVPRIAASLVIRPYADVLSALSSGASIEKDRLLAAHEAYGRAGKWLPAHAGFPSTQARIMRRLAIVSAGEQEKIAAYAEARDGLVEAASRAPAKGFTWALLADTKLRQHSADADLIATLRLAALTSPRQASTILALYPIVMRYWDVMPDDLREGILQDTVYLWGQRRYRKMIVNTYLASGLEARIAFSQKLSEHPYEFRNFNATLQRVSRDAGGF